MWSLNMVRAGAVSHPHEWDATGYKEIQQPRLRYTLIDHQCLMDLLGIPSLEALKGDRSDQYSIRIGDQWRVCFRWTDAGAEVVEVVDYH